MQRVRRWLPVSALLIDKRELPINRATLRLVDYIRGGGTVPPVPVMQVPQVTCPRTGRCLSPGGYIPTGGRHRIAAHKLLGSSHIEVKHALKGGQTAS